MRPLTVSADWCGPNRPPFVQKLPTGTCHTDTGNGFVSFVMSSMYEPARTPLVQGAISAAPAASSTTNAYFRGRADGPKFGTLSYTIGDTVCGPRCGGFRSSDQISRGFAGSAMSNSAVHPELR